MTQKEQLLNLFQENDNKLTLGQIMQTSLGAEYRARMTDLRHQGHVIIFKRGKRPSENLYELNPKQEIKWEGEQSIFPLDLTLCELWGKR